MVLIYISFNSFLKNSFITINLHFYIIIILLIKLKNDKLTNSIVPI